MPPEPSSQSTRRPALSVDEYASGIRESSRATLARAITLIESSRGDDRKTAGELLDNILPDTGQSMRIGISGVPGVGKSTFIEALGLYLIDAGYRVAVLAIDPTSSQIGGSILGDKTRMQNLSMRDEAFIRPSPTSGALGGVARMTRETMLLCEAAGFDVVIVETVGVGQSEIKVASMVDFFLALMLPGAGDELQGIKKGIIEIADMLVINKADPDQPAKELAAKEAASAYRRALQIMHPRTESWNPPVLTCSALHNHGIDSVWEQIESCRTTLTETGEFAARRQEQQRQWMWSILEEAVMADVRQHADLSKTIPEVLNAIDQGTMSASSAAHQLLDLYTQSRTKNKQ